MIARRAALAAGLAASLGLLPACAGDEALAPQRVLASMPSGDGQLEVRADGSILVSFGGARRLVAGLNVGVVGEEDLERAHDPWAALGQDALADPPPTLRWRAVEDVSIVAQDEASIELALDHGEGNTSTAKVQVDASQRWSVSWAAVGSTLRYQWLEARVDAAEGIYGMGEQLDAVNQRGKLRAMQLELGGGTESLNNEAHVPVPALLGTTGWGVFVETDRMGAFDVAAIDPERVDAVFAATGVDGDPPLAVHLFVEEHPLDLVGHLWAVTGAPAVPAPWVYGPLVWRDENDDQAQVERDVDALRDLDLAASGLWIDRPYATAVNTFDFDPARFPDPDRMIAHAQRLGLRMGLWHVPYLDREDEATLALREEAEERGFFPPEVGLLLNGWGAPIDFSNPDAAAWWESKLAPYAARGIEGWKLDYAEDVVPALADAPTGWLFADGSTEATMHARYSALYHERYARQLPPSGGLLLCRHANPGAQSQGIVVWPGDLDATFARAGEPQANEEESWVSVGGLPASVIAGLSLSASGFPFFAADTGGYRHAPPDAELLVRWIQQTALSAVMQVGNGASTVPWEGDLTTVEGVHPLDVFRTYGRLHLRLFPYVWGVAQRMASEGRPILRPMGLAYPELEQHPDDQYLLGPDLLVAPVLTRDAREREVLIPPGAWIDWWTGGRYEGPRTVTVEAPIDRLPLWVREGAIVPMLRRTIDTLAPTSEPERVDSLLTQAGPLWLRAPAGATAARGVAWDRTTADLVEDDGAIAVTLGAGERFVDGTVLELIAFGADPPSRVEVDGQPAGPVEEAVIEEQGDASSLHQPDVAGGTLLVRVPTGSREVRVWR